LLRALTYPLRAGPLPHVFFGESSIRQTWRFSDIRGTWSSVATSTVCPWLSMDPDATNLTPAKSPRAVPRQTSGAAPSQKEGSSDLKGQFGQNQGREASAAAETAHDTLLALRIWPGSLHTMEQGSLSFRQSKGSPSSSLKKMLVFGSKGETRVFFFFFWFKWIIKVSNRKVQ